MIYTNGFIVKCILPVEEKDCIKQHKNYFGIGSYQSWPLRYLDQYMYLDDQIDEESVCSKNGYFFNLNHCFAIHRLEKSIAITERKEKAIKQQGLVDYYV